MDPCKSHLLLALATGVGIAAASGLRAFLPLLALGVAARFGFIQLQPGTVWLAGNPALLALGVAAVLEILADKVPAVDHALDLIATVIRPLAAWLGAYAVLVDWPAPWGALIGLVFGAGALGLHLVKAKFRLGTSAATLGHGNPVVSTAEDLTAGTILIIAILTPILALALVAIMVWAIARYRLARRMELGNRAG